jgi:hypothetical protein
LLGLDVVGEVQGEPGVAQLDRDGRRLQGGVGRAELGAVADAISNRVQAELKPSGPWWSRRKGKRSRRLCRRP